jgi:phenylalanyl-tRNA synthetase beta chain
MSVMRTSLWPGLLSAMQHNLNRQQSRVRLFEAGLTFIPEGGDLPKQEQMLAGVITGRREPESWLESGDTVDFYDLKGDVESIMALCDPSEDFEFVSGECDGLHPGQTAEIRRNGEKVGYIGAIHPQLQKKLGVSQPVYLFQVNVAGISRGKIPVFTELSKYPEVRRDLAVIIDREIESGTVQNTVKEAAGEHLIDLRLFDIYEGKGIDTKRKSLALGLTFQHSSRTLNEDEVNRCVDDVIKALETQFEATLRN